MSYHWRTTIASLAGITIAAGGFYTGLATAHEAAPPKQEIPTPDLRKLPGTIGVNIALEHSKELKLSSVQIEKLKQLQTKLLPSYIKRQQAAWDFDVKVGAGIESGDAILILPFGVDSILLRRSVPIPGMFSLLQRFGDDLDIQTPRFLNAAQQTAWSKLKDGAYSRTVDRTFDLFWHRETQQALDLTPKQRKQLSIVLAVQQNQLHGKPIHTYASADNLGPFDDAKTIAELSRKFISAQSVAIGAMRKAGWLLQYQQYLSPTQILKFEAIVIDRLYVRR